MHERRFVVFVGHRNGAVRAARRMQLDHEVILPVEARDYAPPQNPAFVIATVESGVTRAARLRKRLKVPGMRLETAVACVDKFIMKQRVRAAGIRCARTILLPEGSVEGDRLIRELGLPLVLKARAGSGGRGTVRVSRAEQLPATINHEQLAESFVSGVEMSVESFVCDGEPIFVNLTEYVEPAWSNLLPAPLEENTARAVREFNREVIAALGIERGMTHLELFVTESGPVFGEIGARPPGGQIMRLLQLAYDFDPWEAYIQIEMGQRPSLPSTASRTAAMRFFHPGRGVVATVEGVDECRALPTAAKVRCLAVPGEEITERFGTGQHAGYVILAGREDAVRRDLQVARDTLKIQLNP